MMGGNSGCCSAVVKAAHLWTRPSARTAYECPYEHGLQQLHQRRLPLALLLL